jgi:Tfp pilus assembly protein PilO
MSSVPRILRLPVLAGLAGGLFLLGLAVDLGFTRKQQESARRGSEARVGLRTRWRTQEQAGTEAQLLSHRLGENDLATSLEDLRLVEPIELVAGHLAASNLEREELGTEGSTVGGALRRTRLYLRASGSYAQVFLFLRRLEKGPSLITVDDLRLGSVSETSRLELRLRLSVYQPASR